TAGAGREKTAHVIHPNAVYFLDTAPVLLRVKSSTIQREVREKRLHVSRRAGRYFILGKWVLEWIEAGCHRPAAQPPSALLATLSALGKLVEKADADELRLLLPAFKQLTRQVQRRVQGGTG